MTEEKDFYLTNQKHNHMYYKRYKKNSKKIQLLIY